MKHRRVKPVRHDAGVVWVALGIRAVVGAGAAAVQVAILGVEAGWWRAALAGGGCRDTHVDAVQPSVQRRRVVVVR